MKDVAQQYLDGAITAQEFWNYLVSHYFDALSEDDGVTGAVAKAIVEIKGA